MYLSLQVFVPIIINLIYKFIQLLKFLIMLPHISTYLLQLLGKSVNSKSLSFLIFKMQLIILRGVVIED